MHPQQESPEAYPGAGWVGPTTDDELLLQTALGLQPLAASGAGPIAAPRLLAHHPFQPMQTGLFGERRPLPGDVIRIQDPSPLRDSGEEAAQQLSTLFQSDVDKFVSVEVEEVEHVVDEPARGLDAIRSSSCAIL